MLFITIALRNLLAHRRKNMVVLAVTAGVCMLLFLFLAFSDGEIENIKNGVSSFFFPQWDIRIAHKDFLEVQNRGDNVREITVRDLDLLKEDLYRLSGIKEIVPVIWSDNFDLVTADQKYLGFSPRPVDIDDSLIRSRYSISEGQNLEPGSTGGILLHDAVRRSLPLTVGQEVTLVGKDLFGQISTARMTITGFFLPMADNPNLTNQMLMLPEDLSILSGYQVNEVNQALIRLEKGFRPRAVREKLVEWAEDTGTEVSFLLPDDFRQRDFFTLIYNMIRLMVVVMVMITLLITAFGIMNVVSINLYERGKEIGTYFCLGCEPPFLMAVYTLEICIVNLAGSILGIAAGLGLRACINALEITSTDPGFQVVAGGSVFRLGLSASTIVWILGGVGIITILTAVATLGKALKVSPVVAVRETE